MIPPLVKPTSQWKGLINVPTAQMFPLDIVGANSFGRYPKQSSAETVNMIVADDALVPFMGYEKKLDLIPNGISRGLFNCDLYQHLIAVVNDGVFVIDQNLGVSRVGSLSTNTGDVVIADNQAGQVCIVDGTKPYIFNYNTNTFAPVNGLDFSPSYVTYHDTYFAANASGTPQWRLSGNNEGTSWPADAQHVGQAETKPSEVTAVATLNRPLCVFTRTATDFYADVGVSQASLFPYQRNANLYVNYGCVAPSSIAVNDRVIVWLGSNEKSGVALMYSEGGYSNPLPTKDASSDGINFEISKMVNPERAVGFLFKLVGRLMYMITFPGRHDNKTYLYDFMSQSYYTLTDEYRNHFIAKNIVWFNNDYYFLSFQDGGLYRMSPEINSYNGAEIPRIRVCSSIELPTAERFVLPNITLTMEQGNSKALQFIDVSMSRDGGQSYGAVQRLKINPYGARPNIAQWFQFGAANTFTPQFRFWGNGRYVITGGFASIYR